MAVTHLNKAQIKRQGVVYTPAWLVAEMIKLPAVDWATAKILDPACGDGSFLLGIARHLLKVHKNLPAAKRSAQLAAQIYGFDLDAYALEEARHNLDDLVLAAGLPLSKWALHKLDSLSLSTIKAWTGHFDLIIANPPYVRIQALGPKRRAHIKRHWPLAAKGAADLYLAFFESASKLLSPGGFIAFLTPNSYWHSQAGQPLRQFLAQSTTLTHLVNFKGHQIFPDATTYAAITVARLLSPLPNSCFQYYEGNATSLGASVQAPQNSLSATGQKWELAMPGSRQDLDALNPGGPKLGDVARISTGLATLADACYVFKAPNVTTKQRLLTVTAKDGRTAQLEKGIMRPILKASTLKPGQLTQDLWLLFPYQKVAGKHQIIPESTLKKKFPKAYAYLKSIKPVLDKRDSGRANPVAWYAFGRSQGLDHVFGPKLLTAPMNKLPQFIYRPESDTAFYSGYSLSLSDPSLLPKLAKSLNTEAMNIYIQATSKDYQHGWKSYAKSFIQGFRIPKNWDK